MGIMAYPFYHMRSEPFWSLIPNEGFTDRAELSRTHSDAFRTQNFCT